MEDEESRCEAVEFVAAVRLGCEDGSMITLPVEPGLLFVFARSTGDHDPVFEQQLSIPSGQEVVAPPTFVRAAEHFDVNGEFRLWPGGEPVPEGGGSGRLHAEQHFEYLKPLIAGDRLTAHTYAGRTWSKVGRSGPLTFAEVHTDFYDSTGDVVIRTRKVSVRLDSEVVA